MQRPEDHLNTESGSGNELRVHHQQVDTQGDKNLVCHSVDRVTEHTPDFQILLDLFEEQVSGKCIEMTHHFFAHS